MGLIKNQIDKLSPKSELLYVLFHKNMLLTAMTRRLSYCPL